MGSAAGHRGNVAYGGTATQGKAVSDDEVRTLRAA